MRPTRHKSWATQDLCDTRPTTTQYIECHSFINYWNIAALSNKQTDFGTDLRRTGLNRIVSKSEDMQGL